MASANFPTDVSNYTIMMLDPSIGRTITSFFNEGNGTNEVTIDVKSMSRPVKAVTATIVFHNGVHLTNLTPSVSHVDDGIFKITFTLPSHVCGVGTLSLCFI
jgi:hypothetical protein